MAIIASVLRTFISIIITIISMAAPGLTQDYTAPYAPLNSEKCLLNFAAVSDIHIQTKEGNELSALFTEITQPALLPGIGASQERLDAVVFAGDLTENAYESQWQKLEYFLDKYDIADRIILSGGNHDTKTRGHGDRTSKGLFIQYNKRITGEYVSEMYYSTEVNGYPFIVLCSDSDSASADFSDKQIKWLKSEMKKAAKKDLPIFVICHWPLNQTHGLPVTWGDDEPEEMDGGIGIQSKQIEKILKKYDNVFFINGHVHAGFSNAEMAAETGYQSIESDGSFHSINLPRLTWISEYGHKMIGTGYSVEVYENEVVFRARNYLTNTWIPEYNYTIELV